MDSDYVNRLINYGILFLFRMKEDIQHIDWLGHKFSALDKTNAFLNEVSDLGVSLTRTLLETGSDPNAEIVKLAYQNQPHFKMNMMFGMAISNSFYGNESRVLNAFELISVRSICIQAAINGECSINSAIVNSLSIPVNEVPVEVIQITRAMDEYVKAVKFIEAKIAALDEPDAYPALGM